MPYKRIGKKVYVEHDGKWTLKQTADSVKNAEAALRLLRAVERGWEPTDGLGHRGR